MMKTELQHENEKLKAQIVKLKDEIGRLMVQITALKAKYQPDCTSCFYRNETECRDCSATNSFADCLYRHE